MFISNQELRVLIRESLNKSILNEAGFHKDIKPGEYTSLFGTNKSALVLHKSKNIFGTGKYILVMWNDNMKLPNKKYKNLPGEAWTSRGIQMFRGTSPDHPRGLQEVFSSYDWLLKYFYFPKYGLEWSENNPAENGKAIEKNPALKKVLLNNKDVDQFDFSVVNNNKIILRLAKSSKKIKKFGKQVKEAYMQDRIKMVNVKYAKSKFEEAIQPVTDTLTGIYKDFMGWSGVLISLVELFPGLQPLIPILEPIKKVASFEDLRIKVFDKDFVAAGFAIIGLFDAVGEFFDTIGGYIAKFSTRNPTMVSKLIASNQMIDVLNGITKILEKFIGNEANAVIENLVKKFAGDKKVGWLDVALPNIVKALRGIYDLFKEMTVYAKDQSKQNEKKLKAVAMVLANM